MKIYLFDICPIDLKLNEEDGCIAEIILLHSNSIRGYTTDRFIMLEYIKFMDSVIGKYVDFITMEYDVPEFLSSDKSIQTYVYSLFLSMYEDRSISFSPKGNLLELYNLKNGGCLVVNNIIRSEYILNHGDDKDYLYSLIYLFDSTMNYLYNTESLLEFKRFVFDGMIKAISGNIWKDSKTDTRWLTDWNALLKNYITNLTFIKE